MADLRSQLFTEEHEAFRDTVARFVRQEVEPHAEAWNRAGELPRELWLRMGELGLLGARFPEQYGGSGGDLLYSVVLAEELTRTRCSGLAMAVCDHTDMSANYILEGSEELRQRLLPRCIRGEAICGLALTEPSGGSDVAAIRTRARRDGDYFVLDGQKVFITNGWKADLLVVVARTDTNVSRPHEGISLFVVEDGTPGFRKGRKLEKLGTLASDTAELFFENCRVPAANMLGEEGRGWSLLMADLGLERLIATAIYIAACDEMLGMTQAYCRERKVFGQAVTDFQVNRHRLAELHTETELARTFYYDCCRRYLQGDRLVKETSMIKYYASELANRVAYQCLSLHGGWGYMKEFPISQWFTDVRLYNIGAGTTEVMKEIIAKELRL
jgi:acyl-CoA dehydrogenase